MFKKSLFALATLALTAGVAQAQAAPVAAKPAVPAAATAVPATATAVPATAVASVNGVNPFVGTPLTFEARQRALEESKMQTSLLEEQLKQESLAEDLKVLPMKKQVEVAQATTARMKEELLQKDASTAMKGGAGGTGGAKGAAKPRSKAGARPTRKAKAVAAASPESQPAKPAKGPNIELSSIMTIGNSHSVVLLVDGNILTLKHGDMSPFGLVTVLDSNNIRLGDKQYHVHGATLARVAISDPKPVDPRQAAAAPAAPSTMAAAPVSPAPATFPGMVLPGSSQKSAGAPPLPPLQLPSGVTILPPTAR